MIVHIIKYIFICDLFYVVDDENSFLQINTTVSGIREDASGLSGGLETQNVQVLLYVVGVALPNPVGRPALTAEYHEEEIRIINADIMNVKQNLHRAMKKQDWEECKKLEIDVKELEIKLKKAKEARNSFVYRQKQKAKTVSLNSRS